MAAGAWHTRRLRVRHRSHRAASGGDRARKGANFFDQAHLDSARLITNNEGKLRLGSIPRADWTLTLSGIKDLYEEPGMMDFMGDTTRVFAGIYRGMVADEEEETADVVATGTLRERRIGILERLATFRAEGPAPAERTSAVTRFGVFYFGRLWDVYARSLLPSGPF